MQADLYQKELPQEEGLSGCLKKQNGNESGHHLPPYTSEGHFSLPNSTDLSEKPTKPLETSSNQRVYMGAGTESGELSTLMISEGLQSHQHGCERNYNLWLVQAANVRLSSPIKILLA